MTLLHALFMTEAISHGFRVGLQSSETLVKLHSSASNLNKADGVEAKTRLPSGDQARKVTPPPPTRCSGTQLSAATSQTFNIYVRNVSKSLFQYKSDFKINRSAPTIIAVSTGEADTKREPLGDQAMEVTGE